MFLSVFFLFLFFFQPLETNYASTAVVTIVTFARADSARFSVLMPTKQEPLDNGKPKTNTGCKIVQNLCALKLEFRIAFSTNGKLEIRVYIS